MKTAMTQLIETAKAHYGEEYMSFINFEHFLEKEKNQIIEAYLDGTAQFDNAAPIVKPLTAENYYTQTYTP
jgi:hypothetical protein